jgi:hypothetical protein
MKYIGVLLILLALSSCTSVEAPFAEDYPSSYHCEHGFLMEHSARYAVPVYDEKGLRIQCRTKKRK